MPPSPVLPWLSTGSKFPIGDGDRCPKLGSSPTKSQKKTFRVGGPPSPFSILRLFHSLLRLTSFLSQNKKKIVKKKKALVSPCLLWIIIVIWCWGPDFVKLPRKVSGCLSRPSSTFHAWNGCPRSCPPWSATSEPKSVFARQRLMGVYWLGATQPKQYSILSLYKLTVR